MVSCVKEKQMSTLIPGADRWKYIQQPILSRRSYDIGELGSLTLPIKLSSTLDYTLYGPQSQATQTKFRDDETQTEPWNPPYFVHPTSIDPEVLMIKNLKHGDGLPAGQLEIDMIDRLRKRKAEEELLLCLEKQNRKLALEKRFKLIERQEREDWLIREKEIELLQQNDIEKFEKALSDEYKYIREKKFQQLINKWIECEKSKNEKFEKLQRNAYRDIRKLDCMHKFQKETFRKKKRDIIEEYLDYSSPVYAPPPHMGRIPAVLSNKSSPSTCSPYLTTLEGMKKFETWLDEKGIRLVEIKLPEEKKTTAHIKFEKLLNELCNEISQSHIKRTHSKKLGIQEEPTFSMDQPTVLSDVTEQHHATIIMQKALRGRSSQRKMLLEKERYKDLIEEYHGLHAISIEEKEAIDKKLEVRNKLIIDKEYRNKKEQIMNEIIDEWEGNVVSSMLGLLSREHQRLQQEEFVCLIAARAKQQRELREAEEMWRRHTETQFRELEDQIVRDVQMVEEEAMERYRNYVLADTITTLADEEARIELKLMTDIACLAHLKPVADCLNDSIVLAANDVAVDNLGNINEFSENVTNIHKEVTDKCMNFILSENFISSLADYKVRREMIPLEQRRRYPNDDGEIDFLIQKEQDFGVSEMKTTEKGKSSSPDKDQAIDTEVAVSESLMLEEEICSFDLNGEESDWITEEK